MLTRRGLAVALFAAATSAVAERGDLASCQAHDKSIRAATPLSACRSASGDVAVGAGSCTTVYVDKSFTGGDALGAVTIGAGGTLYVPDATLVIEAKSITVAGVAASGAGAAATLQMGSDACPVGALDPANHVTLRLIGERPKAKDVHVHNHKDGDDCTALDKGIGVGRGGVLKLYGARGVVSDGGVSWTHLARPAGPAAYQVDGAHTREPYQNAKRIGSPVALGGERVLHLARDVTQGPSAWRAGDWIVIGTTSFSPFESEFAKIAEVAAEGTGSRLTLAAETPLLHYHFGGLDPGPAQDSPFASGRAAASFKAGIAANYGVDERAEVGLISRSITLTAQTPAVTVPGDPSLHWGGEMRFCKGYAEVSVVGVEIEKFGKEALGSYPLHFHRANETKWTAPTRPTPPAGTHRIDSNSIHHSYNKCGTIHTTSNVRFSNNVCARITGHIFYQEIGDEFDNVFEGNLGLGAMLNGFGLAPTLEKTPEGFVKGWWEGDYKGREIGFDGLKIANTDSSFNPTHGSCYTVNAGRLVFKSDPSNEACPAGSAIYEAPSGFWLVNPTASLTGNSIGGCQSLGKGYWYVPPRATRNGEGENGNDRYALTVQPLGRFLNNRVHGCYDGIFGETDAGTVVRLLAPKVGGDNDGLNLIARFDGFTASRIRNRGAWMRQLWFVLDNARIASTREGVSLVTSGGLDGNAPGAWELLKNSTVVGWSLNNVDRWGPCFVPGKGTVEGPGCVDVAQVNAEANDLVEKGYPSPAWNFAGFYIYDGPVRIHDTRFVNFRHDVKALLTKADEAMLDDFVAYPEGRPGNYKGTQYEGDAALGWFQSNQSAYPTSTEVHKLTFENTNLRHQVFTDKVNFGKFDDGDKNTAIVDRDGTLTGFRVVDAKGKPAPHRYPVSLNNLPFNATSNAVDECLATGAQDKHAEARPTSLISPADIATLEFGALSLPDGRYPGASNPNVPATKITQLLTFTHDTVDLFGIHRSMELHSRNNNGVWEPKVASGYGYTVHAAQAAGELFAGPVGIPRYINVGLNEVLKPDMPTKPFYARIGVCYTNKDGTHPSAGFTVTRGYRSWGGNGTTSGPELRKYFSMLVRRYDGQTCHNLDAQQNAILTPGLDNTDPVKGCPADGITPADAQCEATGGTPKAEGCVYPRYQLEKAQNIDELTNPDGTPRDFDKYFPRGTPTGLDKYYYDANTGVLFFYVVQDRENARGPSPLGSCRGQPGDDPACPAPDESFYACPPEGCVTYTVRMNDGAAYDPGESACGDPDEPLSRRRQDATLIYRYAPDADGVGRYAQPRPQNDYRLAYVPSPQSPHPEVRDGSEVKAITNPGAKGLPHVAASVPPYCSGGPEADTPAARHNEHER